MTFYQPLNLQYWLVNVLSGSTNIFIGLSMIAIFIASAKFRMPGVAVMSMMVLFTLMMSGTTIGATFAGLLILELVVLGLIIGYYVARTVK